MNERKAREILNKLLPDELQAWVIELGETKIDKAYIVLGIYYEEDFYEMETILHISKTMKGAIKELLSDCEQNSNGKYKYSEYKIKEYYVSG